MDENNQESFQGRSNSNDRKLFDTDPVGKLLNVPTPKRRDILEGLVREARNTIVRVDAALYDEAQMFACISASTVSSGGSLSPFGAAERSDTLLDLGAGNRELATEWLDLLIQSQKNERIRRLIGASLILTRHGREHNGFLYLNQFSGQCAFQSSIPADCKLVIFADVEWPLAAKPDELSDYSPFGNLLAKLNSAGIATMSFVQNSKKNAGLIEREFFLDGTFAELELTPDAAAPREFGGGFHVSRRKISEHDHTPRTFQFWYRVVDKKIVFGWERRDAYDTTTAKQVEMAERQERVNTLKAEGMEQKAIAALFNVTPSTISRDLAKIRTKARSHTAAESAIDDAES